MLQNIKKNKDGTIKVKAQFLVPQHKSAEAKIVYFLFDKIEDKSGVKSIWSRAL